DRLSSEWQHACRRVEELADRPARSRTGRRSAAGAACQGVRHHGQADEELGTGRARRRRGRRTVEGLDSAGGEVRREVAGEGEVTMSRLQLVIEQIVFARNYTLGLLDQTKTDDWFRLPPGGVSHVGWQVGHIAFSEYRLALWRIRGPQPQDDAL